MSNTFVRASHAVVAAHGDNDRAGCETPFTTYVKTVQIQSAYDTSESHAIAVTSTSETTRRSTLWFDLLP